MQYWVRVSVKVGQEGARRIQAERGVMKFLLWQERWGHTLRDAGISLGPPGGASPAPTHCPWCDPLDPL